MPLHCINALTDREFFMGLEFSLFHSYLFLLSLMILPSLHNKNKNEIEESKEQWRS